MEGLMFYFISWSIWVFLTFISNKENPYRLKLSALTLIIITLANIHFSFGNVDIYLGGVFLLLLSYAAFYRKNKKVILYFYLCSFIVTTAYAAFHLFEIFDPIWLIIKKEWLLGISIGYLTILLQKGLKERLFIVISGTMQGEILYAYFLSQYHFSYQIASSSYLDVCSLSIILLIGWSILENASIFFESHFNLIDKGKQRSS